MAYNPNYTSYATDRVVVTGKLNAAGTSIECTNEAGTTVTYTIASILESFHNLDVEISVTTQLISSSEGLRPSS